MKAGYFYDPKMRKAEDGYYQVDIYMHTKKKNYLIRTICDAEYWRALKTSNRMVEYLNSYYKRFGKFKRSLDDLYTFLRISC